MSDFVIYGPLAVPIPLTPQGGPVINVKSPPYNASGNGVANDAPAIGAAITAAVAAGQSVYLPAGTYRLSSNIVIPSGTPVSFQHGSSFTVDAGQTLTINGPVYADAYSAIFAGAGSVLLNASSAVYKTQTSALSVCWFGADPTFTVDSYAAFVAAIAAMGPAPTPGPSYTPSAWQGRTLFVPAGRYRLSQTLYLTRSMRLTGESGGILYGTLTTGAQPSSVLVFDYGQSGIVFQSVFQGQGGRADVSRLESLGIWGNGQTGPTQQPAQWKPSHSYALGAIVMPTYQIPVGYAYQCTGAGSSGSTEPSWRTTAPWPPVPWTALQGAAITTNTAAAYLPSTQDFCQPSTPNGHVYGCTTSGITGGSEPTPWPTNGGTNADGTAVWTDLGAVNTIADGGVTWTLVQAHGVIINAGDCTCRDVTVASFPGNAFHIDSENVYIAGGDVQGNGWTLDNCAAWFCGNNGLYTFGNDSNAGVATHFHATNNLGWGVYEDSFLGNTYTQLFSAFNTMGPFFNSSGSFFGSYCEGGTGSCLNTGGSVVGGIVSFTDDYYPDWTASHVYSRGDIINPAGSGFIFFCAVGGTSASGGSEPSWTATNGSPMAVGKQFADNTVTWQCFGWFAPNLALSLVSSRGGEAGTRPFIVVNTRNNSNGVQAPLYFFAGVNDTSRRIFGWGALPDAGSNTCAWALNWNPTSSSITSTGYYDLEYENASSDQAISFPYGTGHTRGGVSTGIIDLGLPLFKKGLSLGFYDESPAWQYPRIEGNSCIPGKTNGQTYIGDAVLNSVPFPGGPAAWVPVYTGVSKSGVPTNSGETALPWQANTTYAANAWVRPTNANINGHVFQNLGSSFTSSNSTEPTWPTSGTVSDNGGTWTEAGPVADYIPTSLLEDPALLSIDCSAGGTITLTGRQACHKIIQLTGSPGAGFNVVISTPSVLYTSNLSVGNVATNQQENALPTTFRKLIYNTSGQTVTLKTTSGDTGVTLSTTHSGDFWSDGTTMRAVG